MIIRRRNRLKQSTYNLLPWAFLIAVATDGALQNANATTIYKCKQAGGKVTFQESPCASSDSQSGVIQTRSATPPKSAPASALEPTNSDASEYSVCSRAGIKVFDSTVPQSLQHPQAALNLCKKTLPSPTNENAICLNACVQAWVGEYQKKYIDNDQ